MELPKGLQGTEECPMTMLSLLTQTERLMIIAHWMNSAVPRKLALIDVWLGLYGDIKHMLKVYLYTALLSHIAQKHLPS